MAESNSTELKQRREELAQSLPGLGQKRSDTYRANSDALALDRAGVKSQSPEEMARLRQSEETADVAVRDAQLELRQLDAQIENAPRSGGGFGGRLGRAMSRVRGE